MQSGTLQKALFYIAIQIVTLWAIFYQLTGTAPEETAGTTSAGVLILLAVLLFYAHKTVILLRTEHHSAESEKRTAKSH